ncbi:MAG: hypothetical protein FH761_08260 [Firmicutes bacterium]|nr:hypothetical protein [Bacillota bacterium]
MNTQDTIEYFSRLYEDEILYSVLARYHFVSGGNNLKDTIIKVFGNNSVIPTIEFPTHLEYLTMNLGKYTNITSEILIENHTILPFYSVFNYKERIKEISQEMKYGDGKGIKHKIGYIAGSIGNKKGLYYCPLCLKEEYNKFGEGYFHRLHQLQGVHICNKHIRPLVRYPIYYKDVSRLQFIRLDKDNIKFNDEIRLGDIDIDKYKKIVDLAEFIVVNDLSSWNKEKVYDRCFIRLKDKGLTTVNRQIRQRQLYEEFTRYWGENTLIQLDSQVDFNNEYNWLKVLTRNSKRVTHPLRNILFILFLERKGEDFFLNNYDSKEQNLYPCLNPVANHYKDMVIKDVKITTDYKTRKPVGTFKCSCGFVYSRKMDTDMHSVGRIKEFGHIWKSKLYQLVDKEELSLNGIARYMKCDPKTVKKYARELNQNETVIRKLEEHQNIIIEDNCSTLERYIKRILDYIKDNPRASRTEVRNNFQKEYIWLYRNNKEKLNEMLPTKKLTKNDTSYKVDWDRRDKEVYIKIKEEYKRIIDNKEKVRITKTLLGRRSRYLSSIEKNLEKLPLTRNFINSVSETVEQYQSRRVVYITNSMKEQGEDLVQWKIIRGAGLKKPYKESVINKIDKLI